MEVRIAFDGAIGPERAQALEGRSIACGDPTDPGNEGADGQLRIAGARLDDGGRTLVLATDPHSWAGLYLLPIGGEDTAESPDDGLPYDLSGVEVDWEPREGDDDEAGWSGWWPTVLTEEARALTKGSAEHERSFALLERPGRLLLHTVLLLPTGKVTFRLEASGLFEATLGYEGPDSTDIRKGRHGAEWVVESTGESLDLEVSIPTGIDGQAPSIRATAETRADPKPRALFRSWQILPWAPTPADPTAEVAPLPFAFEGGDSGRGEAIFNGEEAHCSACHKVRGHGGEIGPDLDALVGRDPAEVFREIAEPSAWIRPEYTPYAVALEDGRVSVGIVRANGAEALKVLDTDGKETPIARAEVEEMHAIGTSIMPAGMAAALGESKMRDLLTFLLIPPGGAKTPGSAPVALANTAAVAPAQRSSPAAANLPRFTVERAFPALTFDRPVAFAYPDDGSNLLFVNEQKGVIWSFPNDPVMGDRSTFLDIRDKVQSPASGGGNEEGLLGLAFHPNYKENGAFFVYYSSKEGPTGRRSVVSRFRASGPNARQVDPATEERVWASAPDPYGNHNGGCIAFGPDGFLYISLGDSGAADDPLTTGQNPKDWFGSILRIDVDHPAGGRPYGIPADNPARRNPRFKNWAPEVFCIGLRNVWKFSFDRQTGDLWAGDVGQNLWEEVDLIQNGGNYGWSLKEGFHPFRTRQRPDRASPLSNPLVEYPHNPNQGGSRRTDHGLSITGGYVYRGQALPDLVGVYVYADYQSGRIWGLRATEGKAVANGEIVAPGRGSGLNVAAFGEDPAGELYLLGFDGHLSRLVPAH